MSIKIQKDNLLINKIEISKKETCYIEGDCIVPDIKPDIINIIATSGVLSIHKKEISDGKIRFDGQITTYIMYRGNDGENTSIRSVNHILDFSQVISVENINSEMREIGSIKLKSIEGKIINERKINIKAQILFNIKLQNDGNIEFVKGIDIDNLQKIEKEIIINSIVGMGDTKTTVNESLNIKGEEQLAEILKIDSRICNIETKVSYNKVLIKSDMEVAILYSTESGRYDQIQSKFPIMGFIEMNDVTEDCIINPNIQIGDFLLKTNGSQDNTIVVDAEVKMGVVVYNNKKVSLIEDMYCPRKNLKISKKNMNILNTSMEYKAIYSLNKTSELNIGEEKIYEINSEINVEKTKIEKDFVSIIGSLRLNIIKSSNNITSMEVKKIDIPIDYKMKCDGIKEGNNIEIEYYIKNQNIDFTSRGEINVKDDIEFKIISENVKKIEYIDNVEYGNEKNKNKYNVVIYYTKVGDNLWNIAKEYDSTKNEIIKENNLKGEDIHPGTQLFITRE